MDLVFTMLVPFLIAVTAIYGMCRRVDVYDALITGAGEGLGLYKYSLQCRDGF